MTSVFSSDYIKINFNNPDFKHLFVRFTNLPVFAKASCQTRGELLGFSLEKQQEKEIAAVDDYKNDVKHGKATGMIKQMIIWLST